MLTLVASEEEAAEDRGHPKLYEVAWQRANGSVTELHLAPGHLDTLTLCGALHGQGRRKLVGYLARQGAEGTCRECFVQLRLMWNKP